MRKRSHTPSARCKARGAASKTPPTVKVGDVVYLAHDRSKLRPRESYLIVEINDTHCLLQKFVQDQLRARRYTVRLDDCLRAPASSTNVGGSSGEKSSEEGEAYLREDETETTERAQDCNVKGKGERKSQRIRKIPAYLTP